MRSTTRTTDIKINDLAFADDLALLENHSTQSQLQLDSLKAEASAVGLEINVKKTEQLRLNQSTTAAQDPPLKIDGQPISIVNEFKYLGSYMASTDKDVSMRIALAWAAFHRLKSILTDRQAKCKNKNAFVHSGMYLNPALWMRDLGPCIPTRKTTRRLRKDLLPHYAWYSTIRNPHDQR